MLENHQYFNEARINFINESVLHYLICSLKVVVIPNNDKKQNHRKEHDLVSYRRLWVLRRMQAINVYFVYIFVWENRITVWSLSFLSFWNLLPSNSLLLQALVNQVAATIYARFHRKKLPAGKAVYGVFTRDYRYNTLNSQVIVVMPITSPFQYYYPVAILFFLDFTAWGGLDRLHLGLSICHVITLNSNIRMQIKPGATVNLRVLSTTRSP